MKTSSKILIVGTFDASTILCEQSEYEVVKAANYEEAVELLGNQAFDYVITDAALKQEKTGISVLEFIRDMNLKRKPRACLRHDKHSFEGLTLLGYVGSRFGAFAEFCLTDQDEHWKMRRFLQQDEPNKKCA